VKETEPFCFYALGQRDWLRIGGSTSMRHVHICAFVVLVCSSYYASLVFPNNIYSVVRNQHKKYITIFIVYQIQLLPTWKSKYSSQSLLRDRLVVPSGQVLVADYLFSWGSAMGHQTLRNSQRRRKNSKQQNARPLTKIDFRAYMHLVVLTWSVLRGKPVLLKASENM